MTDANWRQVLVTLVDETEQPARSTVTSKQVATAIGSNVHTVARLLSECKDNGYVADVGGARRSHWQPTADGIELVHAWSTQTPRTEVEA